LTKAEHTLDSRVCYVSCVNVYSKKLEVSIITYNRNVDYVILDAYIFVNRYACCILSNYLLSAFTLVMFEREPAITHIHMKNGGGENS